MKQSLHFSLLQLLAAAIIALFVPTNASAQSADDYRVEAEQGVAEAQYNLGLCYDNGLDPNYAEAVKWVRKAAEQGQAEAKTALSRMEETW